jgi:endoglucanase
MATVSTDFDLKLLLSILEQPTAPFREIHVVRRICAVLDDAQVPYFTDPHGNLVLGVASRAEYLRLVREKTAEPLRVFVAHIDHPGFHGTRWKSATELEFAWHGGSPTAHLEGAKVWLADAKERLGEGRVLSAKLTPSGRAIESGVVQVPAGLREWHGDATKIYGGFGFRAPVWQEGEILYTKAADDLVGAFSILSVALKLLGGRKPGARAKRGKPPRTSRRRPPFIGLLTRAEEVGFIGTIGHLELGWLEGARRPLLGVSLETSRTLPGADIGKGPVVRLGDRMTVFDSDALRVFTLLAQEILPDQHQRRIMDGGSCEATALTAYGIPCVGISVPLGNYHNQSFEGGPDSSGSLGPAPEFVHAGDAAGLLALCQGLMRPKLAWGHAWDTKRQEFKKELKKYRSLMRSGP